MIMQSIYFHSKKKNYKFQIILKLLQIFISTYFVLKKKSIQKQNLKNEILFFLFMFVYLK